MSNSNLSRSSTDLATQSTSSPESILCIPNPPRLQHSPSLPNLRFPHRTGHIPYEMEPGIQHRPSAPPSPKIKPPAAPQTRHVKYASIDPTYRKPSGSKTHTRRRTERDEPHSLLTPPLTPSSSIQTTASSDGIKNVTELLFREISRNASEEISDPDTDSTRILLLENIDKDTPISFLDSTLVDALSSAVNQQVAADGLSSSRSLFSKDVIKGINMEPFRTRAEGIPFVFFDVRSAKIARDTILGKQLEEYIMQQGIAHADMPSMEGLSARLITLQELFKILGKSRFLDGIDASFLFSVQKKDSGDINTGTEGTTSRPDGGNCMRDGINTIAVRDILQKFGSIRFFKYIQQEVDQQGLSKLVYHVEFHDMRDADVARRELYSYTTANLKIDIVGGRTEPEIEPFPNPDTAGPSFDGLRIGPPRPQTHSRQRFSYAVIEENGSRGPAPQTTVTQLNTSAEADSPTFFYTTMPYDPCNQNLQIACPEGGMRIPRNFQEGEIPPTVVPEQQWGAEPVYRTACIPPTYCPDGVCHYCPSSTGMTFNPPPGFHPYTFSPSPPSPPVYYPGHMATPQIMPTMIVPSPSPSMVNAYEYMDPRMHPGPYGGSWNYDPAVATVGLPGVTASSSAQFYARDEVPSGRGAGGNSGPFRNLLNAPLMQQGYSQQVEPADTVPQASLRSLKYTAPSPSPTSDHSAVLPANDGVSGGRQGDSNQFNLAKIINGEDTRTTIMIKNIPNKMNDTDLIEYISKVCPRKIDFLYLRMDFKNGCNVGYAFVNFINIEALVHFAQERLGAKWNMFSSEKVLQMSYATYQGKEAQVEKFKNSAIMDERESWRPRIFYSSGPQEGLPEPFPAPTHMRRKERSSHNRGTLFPPGVNSHNVGAQQHGLLQNTPRRYLDDMRMAPGRMGVGDRYQSHGRHADGGGSEPRRLERSSRNASHRSAR